MKHQKDDNMGPLTLRGHIGEWKQKIGGVTYKMGMAELPALTDLCGHRGGSIQGG